MKKDIRAFTLIELLIVVAIIAILAAIAIPNFLEAQVRAKVARVQSEFRTMKTAMFLYQVDTNEWPDSEDSPPPVVDHSTFWNLRELSTPIAYISEVPYQDPFSDRIVVTWLGIPASNHYQYYHWPLGDGTIKGLCPPCDPIAHVKFIKWIIVCVGPCQVWPDGFNWGIAYDSTNGTVSEGTMWVSEVGIFGD